MVLMTVVLKKRMRLTHAFWIKILMRRKKKKMMMMK